eukprot:CCRYP_008333-RD/>CCRYP_008333-RD protein AED:0.09 eAED:0.09 QI:172/1/1/1/0.70/0.72/25/1395/1365
MKFAMSLSSSFRGGLITTKILFLCLSIFHLAIAHNEDIFFTSSARSSSHQTQTARRRLAPEASIIDALSQQLADGIEHPRFTIAANYFDGDSNLFDGSGPFEIDVVLTNPSVTELTSFSVDGISSPVKNSIKLLVADQSLQDGTRANNFAILAVDENKGSVSGIVQKNKKLLKLEQSQGGETLVTEVNYNPPTNWTCLVDATMYGEPNPTHGHSDDHHNSIFDVATSAFGSRYTENRRLYATDTFPNAWSYQVDLYIEVDGDLVNYHDSDTVNMPNTIEYVNALVTAVSAIYEQEIDTHLNVLHIAKTNIYDGAANASHALDIMKGTYEGDTWHYTDPNTGEKPDVHHAILFREAIVGIAFVGSLCNSKFGYGVTGGMKGMLSDIDGAMFWDLDNLAHELGHSFGSLHTHDINGYNPLVDACGNGQCTSLVNNEQVSSGDATIMSYCQTCSGGVANIAATFGGYWYEDDRSNADNWNNNNGVLPYSQEPKRVPNVMYKHVSSRGTCVKPYLNIDIQTCSVDADCHDGRSCTRDTCNRDQQCSNALFENCCGNLMCEVGESDCGDCGPFTIATPDCSMCNLPYGIMFDVESRADVTLTSIEFKLYNGTNNVTVYTASGGFSDKQNDAAAWTKIFHGSFETEKWSFVSVDFSDISLSAGSIQAFYISSTNLLATLANNTSSPLSSDDNVILLDSNRPVASEEFGPRYSNELSWVGSVIYTIKAPVTSQPTNTPSKSPSYSPSDRPSQSPSMSPSNSPSVRPTSSPNANPSMSPSLLPLTSPSTSPSTKLTLTPTLTPSTNKEVTSPPSTSPSKFTSSSPSKSPSATPIKNPSRSPSSTPLSSPTTAPSKFPSKSPLATSATPTSISPSISPSKTPSATPSHSPSNLVSTSAPSSIPSKSPSTSPTKSPSTTSSEWPSSSPSHSPSKPGATSAPSSNPSNSPSTFLTKSPSTTPSERPISSPSHSPSKTGTSSTPSSSPSTSPLASPTKSPSTTPTVTTGAPTGSPSEATASPSSIPTNSPSKSPSKSPLMSSSTPPTLVPSQSPFSNPVAKPTKSPSKVPSISPLMSPTHTPSGHPSSSPLSSQSTNGPSTNIPTPGPSKPPSTVPTTQPAKTPTKTPSFAPTTTSPTSKPMTVQPSKQPVTFQPATASPSSGPITSQPTMRPVNLSPTLLYSVDLCYRGCGNFTSIDTNNDFNDLLLKSIPCSPELCVVNIVAQSNQCSNCTVPVFRRFRSLQDSSTNWLSSAVTFEIKSKSPLNEELVTANLNDNLAYANNVLSASNSPLRVDSNFTTATHQPTVLPTHLPTQTKSSKSSGKSSKSENTVNPTPKPVPKPEPKSGKPKPEPKSGKPDDNDKNHDDKDKTDRSGKK